MIPWDARHVLHLTADLCRRLQLALDSDEAVSELSDMSINDIDMAWASLEAVAQKVLPNYPADLDAAPGEPGRGA